MSTKSIPFITETCKQDRAISASKSQLVMTACILAADILTLCLVFSLTALGRHIVTPTYQFGSERDLPLLCAMMIVGFAVQGLYPGVEAGGWRGERRAMEVCAPRKCVRATDPDEYVG